MGGFSKMALALLGLGGGVLGVSLALRALEAQVAAGEGGGGAGGEEGGAQELTLAEAVQAAESAMVQVYGEAARAVTGWRLRAAGCFGAVSPYYQFQAAFLDPGFLGLGPVLRDTVVAVGMDGSAIIVEDAALAD